MSFGLGSPPGKRGRRRRLNWVGGCPLPVAHDQADLWRALVDEGRGECLLQQDLPPFEQATDSALSNSLEALEHLALFGSLYGEAVA